MTDKPSKPIKKLKNSVWKPAVTEEGILHRLPMPYSEPIDREALKNCTELDSFNRELHQVNPNYLSFLPDFYHLSYGIVIGWVYFCIFYFFDALFHDFLKITEHFGGWTTSNYFSVGILSLVLLAPTLFIIIQVFLKRPFRKQFYFLKGAQKVAYYKSHFFKPFELQVVDYKDLIPGLSKTHNLNGLLNLYVVHPETRVVTHHLKLEDMTYNHPQQQWDFIRTYMELPPEELPIKPDICQAYPDDLGKSAFACGDIGFRKTGVLNTKDPDDFTGLSVLLIALFGLFYLARGVSYQCTPRAILHPDVQKLLTWDGKDNPYPIQPVTEKEEKMFSGEDKRVSIRWVVGLTVHAILIALITWVFIV